MSYDAGMRRSLLVPALVLAGCCSQEHAPVLAAPSTPYTDIDAVWEVPVADLVLESRCPVSELEFAASSGDNLDVGISGDDLYAIPAQGFSGREAITVTATDRCAASELSFELAVGALAGDCGTEFRWVGAASSVQIAGAFSDWEPLPMAQQDGAWVTSLDLAPGDHAYKFIVDGMWTCDPSASGMQCDSGYDAGTWAACGSDGTCNSVVHVDACEQPELLLTRLDIDRQANTVEMTVAWQPGTSEAAVGAVDLTLDGQPLAAAQGWTGAEPLELSLDGLADGRHTVRVGASDAEGHSAPELYVPMWLDDRGWDGGVMYYAFVDRFDNGDPSNDNPYGSSHAWTDYMGGDWQGIIDRLDYLDGLGVTAIWLTAPQNNGDGVFGDKCGATFTGYHGYWPSDPWQPEEHFGTEAKLRELIDKAHARGMRVLVDWVANHVHDEHPYATEHPEWFNEQRLCNDANNWDDIPETCWFDPFLPDIDYYRVDSSAQMVDDAIAFAKEYELDGYRVDAVKHMPHSVFFNLQQRIKGEIEHRAAGGDEDFYTVGETFDGRRDLIGSYVNDDELDAQFDFPFYFTLRSALIDQGASFADLESSWNDSRTAFSGHTMSTFLGNHDVPRFVTVANEGDQGPCASGSEIRQPAAAPDWDVPYDKLELGWTFLLTHEGLPLIYYGDELGLPGHQDPDNRQFMRFSGLSARESGVLDHVTALGQARRQHPVLSRGTRSNWWQEDDVLAWSREHDGAAMVAAINRSGADRQLSNGLSFAGLPTGGTWRDVLTGDTVVASGDNLTFTVAAGGSRVWLRE